MKITTAWLDSRTEKRNRRTERYDVTVDGREGLMVRVYPSGAVSFVFRYTPPGGRKRVPMILGPYGKGGLSLADAFDKHHQAHRELALGLDPIEEREKRADASERERRERTEAGTVAELVEQFVHRRLLGERWDAERSSWTRDPKAKTKPRKRPAEAAALLGYRLPDMPPAKRGRKTVATLLSKHGADKAREISKRQLIALLDGIVDRGAPVMANRVYALLKQLFSFGAAKDIIPASPMAGIEPPGGIEGSRNRKLSPGEIRTVWGKLDTAAMAPATRLAVKLLLVTAQRRGEVTFARKSHFNLEAAVWSIPPELQKTEGATKVPTEPHLVPLSALAVELVRELITLAGESEWLLPSQYTAKKRAAPYSERALTRAVKENQAHFGIPHWTPHDLRRTASSTMTKIGIPRLHVEKVLNHATDNIAEVYDRHDYLPEKRAALEKWAAHLKDIIEAATSS